MPLFCEPLRGRSSTNSSLSTRRTDHSHAVTPPDCGGLLGRLQACSPRSPPAAVPWRETWCAKACGALPPCVRSERRPREQPPALLAWPRLSPHACSVRRPSLGRPRICSVDTRASLPEAGAGGSRVMLAGPSQPPLQSESHFQPGHPCPQAGARSLRRVGPGCASPRGSMCSPVNLSLASLLPTGREAPGLRPCSLHTEDPSAGGESRKPVTAVSGVWPAALQLRKGELCGLGALGHFDGAAPVSTGLHRWFRRKHQKHAPLCGSRSSPPAAAAFLFTSDQRGPETKPAGWRGAEAEEQDSQRVRPRAPWSCGVPLPNCPCWLTERAAHSPPAALGPESSWVSPFPGQPRLDARRSRHPGKDRASLPAASPLHITRTHRFCLRSFQQPPRSSSLGLRASWGPFTLPGPGRACTATPDSGPSPVGQLVARLPVHAVSSRGRTGETGGP